MMPDILSRSVRTPVGEAPVVPVMIIAFGAYLCWFGVHYWRSDVQWPTDPLKAVLTGKPIPEPEHEAASWAFRKVAAAAGAAAVIGGAAGALTDDSGGGGGGAAGTMSKDQIAKLWTDNGGSKATANLAAAVAMAESSGRTGVPSRNPDGGTNVGLWQLDTMGVGAGYTVQQLQDPQTNARITIMATANGTKWGYWEAYTKGAYKKYL